MNEIKPGYKTTEFWLSLIAMLIGTLMASGLFSDGSMPLQIAGMAMAVLSNLGYTASRGKAKLAESLGKSSAPKE